MHNSGETGADDSSILHRLIFFSDAVFAIVLTLLVLELRPPQAHTAQELAAGLQALAPHFMSFVLTFAVVSIFWAAHMSYTRRMAAFDWPTAWLNLLLLFTIALLPFASALLGEHGDEGLAWQVYCSVLVAASLAQTAVWLVLSRNKGRLIGGVTGREIAHRTMRGLSPAIAFGAGYASMLAGRGDLVVWCWALIPVVMLLAAALFGARRPRPA